MVTRPHDGVRHASWSVDLLIPVRLPPSYDDALPQAHGKEKPIPGCLAATRYSER